MAAGQVAFLVLVAIGAIGVLVWSVAFFKRVFAGVPGGAQKNPDEVDWYPMDQLCWVDSTRTIYGVDNGGRVWYIDMRTGSWALHGNPTVADLKRSKPEME